MRTTTIQPHLSKDEIMERIKRTTGFWKVQRWLAIYNGLDNPRPAKDIARSVGLAEGTIHNLISAYNRNGEKAVESPGKGGRRRCYMSFEEETAFLKQFEDQASEGRIATTLEIKKAYEARLGKVVHETTIYRILKKHGWRKIVPRSYHTEANKEAQIEFKKTSKTK